ncbi:CaiF/GrlA family transcriptional regulator [Salmonella enterica subsp. salamae]|nr:CaiF/GrlA family transcriptional regulator [Salmonella enterica]ECI5144692.1 CaiF/GrlA family transcriptional regulator [Salmonella enterica subsp. salamae]ECP4590047.1 CaiF/GrlA family transcriptional regulator [Salmonella enterica subsp. enterica serovar Muenchen]HAE4726064.1 CaiF/GrlA family transcriptional regulator [Salmonella enterica subsp. salamae serovar 47:a:1,5]EAY7468773.1 CaiF/GrlA family transcriptional regulator [Salmonella enterica]
MSVVVSATRGFRSPEAYRLPESLQDARFSYMPLYLLVAWWILLRGTPATVRDVCAAFHISPRRAGDIFLYLSGADHINCRRSWLFGTKQKGRRLALSVYSIGDPSSDSSSVRATKTVSVVRAGLTPKPEAVRGLRSWMVTRHVGEPVPVKYLSSGYGRDGK